MALHNTGYQANLAIAAGAAPLDTWQTGVMGALGLGFAPDDLLSCLVHGGLYYVPILLVTFAVGGLWELLFAVVRRHELNEGFLVTGMLFPLVLPPTIPLWQVALGISFGIVVGKEIFGGTGMNVLNPALVARAFVFFAYPAEMSGDADLDRGRHVHRCGQRGDGAGRRHPRRDGRDGGRFRLVAGAGRVRPRLDGRDLGAGLPGRGGPCSIGSGVGSWRIMLSVTAGTLMMAAGLNAIGSATNPFFDVSPAWHLAHRRLGVRHRLHGHRPGVGAVGARRPLGLRLSHRRAHRAHSRREPGVS